MGSCINTINATMKLINLTLRRTCKLTHTPSMVQRIGGGWTPPPPCLGFRSGKAKQNKLYIHCLDSPELATQDDFTIFVSNEVIQRQMTPFDLPSWICHLGFHHFPFKSRNNGN